MPIIAIDPGNVQSGYCVIDQKTLRPLEFGKIDNEELLKSWNRLPSRDGGGRSSKWWPPTECPLAGMF